MKQLTQKQIAKKQHYDRERMRKIREENLMKIEDYEFLEEAL